MSRFISFSVVVGFFVWAGFVSAQMTSTNYEIRWDTVSTGGSDTASSSSYQVRDSAEAAVGGTGTSNSYQLDQGYRSSIFDQVITFDLFSISMSSARAATALSGTTVTAGVSGIDADDYIAVVQDVGTNNIAAIGKVTSVGAGTITVDVFKDAGTTPTINGTDDYVYILSGTTMAFGELSTESVAAGIIGWEVTVDNDNGYVVQVMEDGEFRDGTDDIDDVADGSVTSGDEEYGGRSSDVTLSGSTFDSADTGITTTFQDVATESTFSFESRNFLTLKTAVSSLTDAGSYAHTISFIASGNF